MEHFFSGACQKVNDANNPQSCYCACHLYNRRVCHGDLLVVPRAGRDPSSSNQGRSEVFLLSASVRKSCQTR